MDPNISKLLKGRNGLRIVGDVHGNFEDLAIAVHDAINQNYAILLLGDIIDYGDDSAKTIEIVIALIHEGWGLMVPGNHDAKFLRWIRGHKIKYNEDGLGTTIKQLKDHPNGIVLAHRFAGIVGRSPVWIKSGKYLFVHAGFHLDMLKNTPGQIGKIYKKDVPTTLALHGETQGDANEDGSIIRTYSWIDSVPKGLTVCIGHDCLSQEKIIIKNNAKGGKVAFLDTGSGEGGRLSWMDIPKQDL